MILYADTSALFKLVVAEDGSQQMEQAWITADSVLAASIGYVELRSAVAAARRANRISSVDYQDRVAALDQVWNSVSEIAVDHALLRTAGDVAERMALRGYDAVHLAALLRTGIAGEVSLASWDMDLRRAAAQLGYSLIPV